MKKQSARKTSPEDLPTKVEVLQIKASLKLSRTLDIIREAFFYTTKMQDAFRQASPDERNTLIQALSLSQSEVDLVLQSPMGSSILNTEDYPQHHESADVLSAGAHAALPAGSAKMLPQKHEYPRISDALQDALTNLDDETIRPGRPLKGKNRPALPTLRRLQIKVSDRTFERLERLRQITKAPSSVGVIRDALRVYEAYLGVLSGPRRPSKD